MKHNNLFFYSCCRAENIFVICWFYQAVLAASYLTLILSFSLSGELSAYGSEILVIIFVSISRSFFKILMEKESLPQQP